jgi:hypothetical protein
MLFDFQFLICNLEFFCTFLVYEREYGLIPKRARRAIGTVCDACGKQFVTSYASDQHRTSGYLLILLGTGCHVLDDDVFILPKK